MMIPQYFAVESVSSLSVTLVHCCYIWYGNYGLLGQLSQCLTEALLLNVSWLLLDSKKLVAMSRLVL
jgi:hypothetical protein